MRELRRHGREGTDSLSRRSGPPTSTYRVSGSSSEGCGDRPIQSGGHGCREPDPEVRLGECSTVVVADEVGVLSCATRNTDLVTTRNVVERHGLCTVSYGRSVHFLLVYLGKTKKSVIFTS